MIISTQFVQNSIDTVIDLLNTDQLQKMSEFYIFPFVIQMKNRLAVFSAPADGIAAWQAYRHDYLLQGWVQSRGVVKATEVPRRGRFRVWIDMLHLDQNGVTCATAQMILFCRVEADHLRIEMQHVTQPALVDTWTAAGNLSSLA